MSAKKNLIICLTAALLLSMVLFATADEAVDKAFADLKTYDWGADRAILKPIDDAVAASNGDAAAGKALETALVAVLAGDGTRAAKDFACRKLSLIGTDASVSALGKLLGDEKLSHMGRYALERMKSPAAVAAMRDAVAKAKGRTKIGLINSLGVCRDAESTKALVALLGSDKDVAAAAAAALGKIGSPDAAKALGDLDVPEGLGLAVADARLTCAEQLLADGKKLDALKVYQALNKPDQPKHVKLAAMRGLLAAAKAK